MKNPVSFRSVRALAIGALLATTTLPLWAQENTTPPAPRLSSGVADVLKLSQAKINEDTIVAYVQNSDRTYGLKATEIVYLRDQGVSDKVVAAMLNQRSTVPEAPAKAPPQPASWANTSGQATATTASAPQYVQPAAPATVTYVQPAPVSTVYVIPNSPRVVSYSPYYSYPSYSSCGYNGYYYSGYYPRVSLSVGFGGFRGGYYGGFHGRGFRCR